MADKVEETMENSSEEDQDNERPPTPDYHHMDKEDEALSEISIEDNEENQDKEESETLDDDKCNIDSNIGLDKDESSSIEVGNPTKTNDDENTQENDSVDDENLNDKNDDSISNTDETESEVKVDSEEQEKGPISPTISESSQAEKDNSSLHEKNNEALTPNEDKNSSIVESLDQQGDEDNVPVSPVELGLSEQETAIAENVLKEDDIEDVFADDSIQEQDEKETENDEKQADDMEDKYASEDDADKLSISGDVDDDRSEPDEGGGDQLIQDIFGASDEEEEFEGFDQDEIEISRPKKDAPQTSSKSIISDDEDEGVSGEVESMVVPKPIDKEKEESDSDDDGPAPTETVWDFDLMMEQKKLSRAKKRRRKGDSELISDSDDLVVEMIKQMKQAAEDDKLLNEAKQAATKKLKLLPSVLTHLNKADLQFTFIDSGILNALKDWLSPLPDGSLPHLQIRTGLLKILSSFPALDTGALKMSGLGKAIMYIFRHPKEIRQNKNIAGKLINEWARPIFGVTSNFKSMSREEREERDYQNMSKRRRLSSAEEGGRTPRSIDRALQGDKKGARPGEKGFIMRARVPTPSNKDYVVRPKSSLEALDFHRVNKVISRADKQMRKFKDRSKAKAPTHAATISIEGRKMGL